MQRLEQILHKGIYPNEHCPYEELYSLINHQKTHMVYQYLAIKGRQWKRPIQLLVRVCGVTRALITVGGVRVSFDGTTLKMCIP